jgi:predicted amidohydrolase
MLAAAQYGVSEIANWDAYAEKIGRWVAEAVGQGARLLVFPEYGAMELAALFGPKLRANVRRQVEELQHLLEPFLALHCDLAYRHGVYLLAGSFPVREGRAFVNRAHFFAPDGRCHAQDKLVLTPWERENWGMAPGATLNVFETAIGRIGVNVCYDAEFPLLARQHAEAGAELLLVPSATDTLAGHHRVRVACRARAVENQLYVVHAPLLSGASWSEAIDVNVGAAGIFAPCDRGLPDDGVLAEGELNWPAWIYAHLDLAALRAVREEGDVRNLRDWQAQRQWAATPATVVRL